MGTGLEFLDKIGAGWDAVACRADDAGEVGALFLEGQDGGGLRLFAKALQGEDLFSLGLEFAPKAVVRARGLPEATLQHSRDIVEVFREWDGQLLILGAPGGGKTILLLQLAKELLNLAEAEVKAPIPVVLNLSSWAAKRLPLRLWLEEALHVAYQVPKQVGREWVESQRLLLLLDGLDEVGAQAPATSVGVVEWELAQASVAARRECVAAINGFLEDFPKCPMVVCSRIRDYDEIGARVNLRAAVTLQPLDQERAMTFLEGEDYADLRTVVKGEAGLREMLVTPFLLNLVRIAYRKRSLAQLALGEVADAKDAKVKRRDDLIETYIERQLEAADDQAKGNPLFVSRLVRLWLTFLARQMQARKLSVFYIEELQHDWLPNPLARMRYVIVGSLLFGVSAGVLGGCSLYLTGCRDLTVFGWDLFHEYVIGFSVGGVMALLAGVLGRISHGSLPQYGWQPSHTWRSYGHNSWITTCWAGVAALLFLGLSWAHLPVILWSSLDAPKLDWMLVGTTVCASLGIGCLVPFFLVSTRGIHWLMSSFKWWLSWLASPLLSVAVVLGWLAWRRLSGDGGSLLAEAMTVIVVTVAFVVGSFQDTTVKMVGRLKWRWNWKGCGLGFVLGLILAISQWIQANPVAPDVPAAYPLWWFPAFCVWWATVFGVWSGVQKDLRLSKWHRPAQGLTQTMVSSGMVIAGFMLSGFALFSVYGGMLWMARSSSSSEGMAAFKVIASAGLGIGFVVGLFMSGVDALIKHAILRVQLWFGGWLPFRLVRFLDHGEKCLLLRRVGAGYIFLHRYLLEYLAKERMSSLGDNAGLAGNETRK